MSLPVKTRAWAILVAGLAVVLALPQHAAAQDGQDGDDPPSRVARLSYVQGSISFQPAGDSDWASATINRPITTGDKLWSEENSRAEVDLGSAAIRLSGDTGFSFLNLDDHTAQVQLSAGTLHIRVRRLARNEVFEVDTANQAFSILRPGEYRVQASEDGASTRIEVRAGQGEAAGADHTYTLERGQRATLTGSDSLSADVDTIKEGDRDDFEEWSEMRDAREDRSSSASYVAPDLVGYTDLDENGLWQNDAEYGQTWFPTTVPAGWAPYHYGRWEWIAPWGWTWVDDAAWGYAPFHYGRWAYTQRGWGWVPGPAEVRPVYAPALVAFVGAQNLSINAGAGGAAMAWFPLGPREVYVPGYEASREYVNRVNLSNARVSVAIVANVYDTTMNGTQATHVTYVNRTAPGAISAVPEEAFRGAQPVDRVAVRVSDRDLGDAGILPRAKVAPTRSSVLGAFETREGAHVPPQKIVERPVFARTTPAAAPVPFEEQAAALAAHPGEPLRRIEAETLRSANAQSAHSMIRQIPGRQMEAGERPVSVRPEERGVPGVQTEAQPRYQPAKEQSGFVQPSNGAAKEMAQPNSRPAVRVFEEQGSPEPPPARQLNSNRAAKQGSGAAGSQQQGQARTKTVAERQSIPAPKPVSAAQMRAQGQTKPASASQPATAANKDASDAVHGKIEKKLN